VTQEGKPSKNWAGKEEGSDHDGSMIQDVSRQKKGKPAQRERKSSRHNPEHLKKGGVRKGSRAAKDIH